MKQLYLSICTLLATAICATAQISMPSRDGAEQTVPISEQQTFYDSGGASSGLSTSAAYVSRVTFTPRPGEVIELRFESLSLTGATISIFDGTKALVRIEGEFDPEEVTYTIPSGHRAKLSRLGSETTYVSSSSDGALTVMLSHSRGSGDWVAHVRSIPNTDTSIRMGQGHTTHTISSPQAFYDDGGRTGQISSRYNGTVTFEPSDAGKRVRLTFDKLDLFNTSNTGMNDILKVYSGRTADEAHLIATVLKEATPLVFNSASEDGCITVTLRSTTGVPKAGFEARVEQVTPETMRLVESSYVAPAGQTAMAGQRSVLVQRWRVRTSGVLSPLSLTQLTLGATGAEHIAACRVYYEGRTAGSTGTLVGEQSTVTDQYTLSLAQAQSLVEGDNFFRIEYDLRETAPSGVRLGATVRSQVIGTSHELSGETEPTITVDNTYRSTPGEHTVRLYGDWTFTHTPQSAYIKKYKAHDGPQTTTFVPSNPRAVVQLDFTAFDLYISSSSYQPQSRFIVYDGTVAEGRKLFEATAQTKNKLPLGGRIRSSRPGGVVTVVFDAKTSTSTYTANGWQATVSQYEPRAMQISSVEVTQASTAHMALGATLQPILGVRIQTEGTTTPISLSELRLQTSTARPSKVSIFATATNVFATDRLLGEVVTPDQDVRVALGGYTLSEGDNFLWVAYDIAAESQPEQSYDAAAVSLGISGATEPYAITNGNPEGVRTAKAIHILQEGTHTLQLGAHPIRLYDDGGAEGNYTQGKNFRLTIKPRPGELVKLIFHSFNTTRNDKLIVYSGAATGQKLQELSSRQNQIAPILSTAEDGALTLVFDPKTSSYLRATEGFDIEVQSYVPRERTARLEVVPVSAEDIRLRSGESYVPVFKVMLHVEGDRGTVTLPNLALHYEGAPLAGKLRLLHTKTFDFFSIADEHQSAPVSGAQTTLSSSKVIDQSGTYYYWVAVDAAAALTTDATATLSIDQTRATLRAATGMHGTYRVGLGGDYEMLEAAFAALGAAGLDGAVTLRMIKGTYTGKVSLPAVPGSSETNTITIISETGQAEDVIFEDRVASAAYGSSADVFTVNGTDFLTLEQLTIRTDNANLASVLKVTNAALHVTVRGCKLSAPQSSNPTGQSIKVVHVKGGDSSTPAGDNHFFTLEQSQISGGYSGVYVDGTGVVALPNQRGARILDNQIVNQGWCGIYMTAEDEGLVRGNSLRASGTIRDYRAIDAILMGNTQIIGNRIKIAEISGAQQGYNSLNNDVTGIHLRHDRGNAQHTLHPGRNRVVNNVLHIIVDGTRSARGVLLSDTNLSNLDILHNTVYIAATAPSVVHSGSEAIATYRNGAVPQDVQVRGNILYNTTTGLLYRLHSADLANAIASDYNLLWGRAEKLAQVGSDKLTFAEWQARAKDANSRSAEVQIDPETLDLTALDGLRFVPAMEGVTHDIVGRTRPDGLRTPGAYEYAESTIPSIEGQIRVLSLGSRAVRLGLIPTASGTMYYELRQASEPSPSLEEMKTRTAIAVKERIQADINLSDLSPATEYKLYILMQSPRGAWASAVVEALAFRTAHRQTEVSTFDQVELGASTFEDGTASFAGFVVEDAQESEHQRIARIGQGAIVRPTNMGDEGQRLEGFEHRGAATTLHISLADGSTQELSLPASDTWVYIDLKRFGRLLSVRLSTEGNAWIDNWSKAASPLTIAPIEGISIRYGELASLTAKPLGGAYPYTYRWLRADGSSLGTAVTLRYAAEHSQRIDLEVTDARGSKVTTSIDIIVLGGHAVATFEDLTYPASGYWMGDREKRQSQFFSGSYTFDNTYAPSLATWAGFAYSRLTGTTFDGLFPGQFRSAVGHGAGGSAGYGVCYTMGGSTRIYPKGAGEDGTVISGCYITNTAWVKYVSEHGTGMEPNKDLPFDHGDWLRVTAHGDNGREVEFYLADHRSQSAEERYTLTSWQWFDLTPLGKVKSVRFSMEGTRHNASGSTIPFYFCLDDFGGTPEVKTLGQQAVTAGKTISLELTQLIGTHLPQSWRTRARYEVVEQSSLVTASVAAGTLTVVGGSTSGQAKIRLRASAQGESVYVELPIEVKADTALERIGVSALRVMPSTATHTIRINASGRVQIFSMEGVLVQTVASYVSDEAIDISELPQGSYLVRIGSETLRWMKR